MTEGVTWHRTCHHSTFYRISCEQYSEQVLRTGNCCQLCGVPAAETADGILFIDHAAEVGQWAVRGLLCSRCNAALGMGNGSVPAVTPEAIAQYLNRPWYQRILDAAGVGLSIADPGHNVQVMVNGRPLRRLGRSWAHVVHSWGPHNIHVMQDAASADDLCSQPSTSPEELIACRS